MIHKNVKIVETLSSLYELSLCIGQSHDRQENAEEFLKRLMIQRNLSFAAYYEMRADNQLQKIHSIPFSTKNELSFCQDFYTHIGSLKQLNIGKDDFYFAHVDFVVEEKCSNYLCYHVGTKGLVVLGRKELPFRDIEMMQLSQVVKKFGNLMESLASHQQINEEVKLREEQAKLIEIRNQQLIQQNKELSKYAKSNDDLENFAAMASHDLKAPLRTIVSFSKILEKSLNGRLKKEEKEYLEFIQSSGKRMSNLISSLLAYSKINSNGLELKELNIQHMLERIKLELQSVIQEKQGTLDFYNLPKNIHADKIKLHQLFQNLIANGIKFIKPNCPPKINITAKENEDFFQFSVSDNGVGIAPEYQERIFGLFQRLHTEIEYTGSGIGLAMCKDIVEQHGGKIWVESEIGKGTTFHFTISKVPSIKSILVEKNIKETV